MPIGSCPYLPQHPLHNHRVAKITFPLHGECNTWMGSRPLGPLLFSSAKEEPKRLELKLTSCTSRPSKPGFPFSLMGVSEATQLKMAFVGGIDAGTTSLIRTITKGYSPEASQPPHTKYVYFDPSSYQPASHRVIETTETKTGRPKHGKWLAEKRRAFWLTFEDFDARGVLRYTDAAVVALCFSVAARESFNMIRTKVRRVYFT